MHSDYLVHLLSYATTKSKAEILAHALLERYGHLGAIFSTTPKELLNTPGMTKHIAILLFTALATVSYARREEILLERKAYKSAKALGCMFAKALSLQAEEHMLVALLDENFYLIDLVQIAHGSVNSASIDIRTTLSPCIRPETKIVAVAHNHPHGTATPSLADKCATDQMKDTFLLLGIPFLDHFVVSGEYYTPILREDNDEHFQGCIDKELFYQT